MQPLALQRGVQLAEHGQPHVTIFGDQTRLSQLLINLVDNALRYTSSGGMVNVALREQAGWAELSVEDTGTGIAAEHLPHLFERFYRADPARSRADGGAGLGLAIVQWITQAHGGAISVMSEFGRGSTFTVRIPLVQVTTARSTTGAVESVAARIAQTVSSK